MKYTLAMTKEPEITASDLPDAVRTARVGPSVDQSQKLGQLLRARNFCVRDALTASSPSFTISPMLQLCCEPGIHHNAFGTKFAFSVDNGGEKIHKSRK